MSNGIDFPRQTTNREAQALAVQRFETASGSWVNCKRESTDHRGDSLTLVTFNTWFQGPDPDLRYAGLIDCVLQSEADIVLLQETTVALLDRLLSIEWIRNRYMYARAPFRADAIPSHGLMMLSRIPLGRVTLHPLPTHMGRWLLVADLKLNGVPFRVATVHLESMKGYGDVRGEQLKVIFGLLENAPRAVLAGDFNFCSSWPQENNRIDPRYLDLWATLRPSDPGYTQDTDINLMLAAAKREVKKVRFDRILLRSDTGPSQWIPERIELMGTSPVSPKHRKVFPSDHFGLRAIIRHQTAAI